MNFLKSLKYGLNRLLRKQGHEFDITKSPNYVQCMKNFDLACLELKQQGKGYVKNNEEINDEGKNIAFYAISSIFGHFFHVFIVYISRASPKSNF